MGIAQEPFCVEIYRKNAGPDFRVAGEHLVRTPSVWPHCLGKNQQDANERMTKTKDSKDSDQDFTLLTANMCLAIPLFIS